LAKFRLVSNINEPVSAGSELILSLTERANLFIFSYSVLHKSLVSWTDNASKVLGVKDIAIAREANLFLRHAHSDDRFFLLNELESALKGEKEYRVNYRWIRPDNDQMRTLHCRASLVKHGSEEMFEGIIIDLSDELSSNLTGVSKADSGSTEALLDSFPDIMLSLDHEMRILKINEACKLSEFNFGDTNLQKEKLSPGMFFPGCFSDASQSDFFKRAIAEVIQGKKREYKASIKSESTTYDLKILPLASMQRTDGALLVFSKADERIELENKLLHAGKQAKSQLLADGVLENITNSLQALMAQAAALKHNSNEASLVEKSASDILETISKTSRMLNYFSDHVLESDGEDVVDLNVITMAAVNSLEGLFLDGLKISVSFGSLSSVRSRKALLQDAIETLIKEARQSTPGAESLVIKTSEVSMGDGEIEKLRAGDYGKLTIASSSSEIGEQTSDGRLKLTDSFEELRKLNGVIVQDSAPGMGTTISVYLPIQAQHVKKNQRPTVIMKPEVLILDDDAIVSSSIQDVLLKGKIYSITAQDVRAACNMLRTKNSIRLVLLDAVMPGVAPATVLKTLMAIKPELQFIAITGADPSKTLSLVDAGALEVLRKPVKPEVLQMTVQKALQAQTELPMVENL